MDKQKQLANAIRILSMDAVQQAKSGHPGAPMGMADIAEVLWRKHLRATALEFLVARALVQVSIGTPLDGAHRDSPESP